MSTLLHIDSSPMGQDSLSRQLTSEFARRWQSVNPEGTVISRDLNAVAIPLVEAAWVKASCTPEESRTADQKDLFWLSGQFTRELLKADEYVIGVPVHNGGPPASLKLWVDHTVTPFGPRLDGKRATCVITAGRLSGPGAGNAAKYYVEPWLRTLFGRLGVRNLHFVFADGTVETKSGKIDGAAFLAPHIEAIQALFADALCL
jgi:FMN-dependent NADH-azoreductase